MIAVVLLLATLGRTEDALREEMVKSRGSVSLRPILKVGRKVTTPDEVESVSTALGE